VFGLDDAIASRSDGHSLLLVAVVAVLLGLRHATDPDHVAAVTTLVASSRERATRTAARLGLAWGLGHATTLFVFGLPIVFFRAALPDGVQRLAEAAVGVLIVCLALRLLLRWRRGSFHVHAHEHGDSSHRHLHEHARSHGHEHPHRGRTALAAFAIGLVHGMAGSAGVGILLIAGIGSSGLAVLALGLLAAGTAVSMTMLTTGFGRALVSRPVRSAYAALAPALGAASLAFGIWYALGALELLPSVL
jgi:ABC-type nickel/cobalt efflux system permease component RcnA